MNDISGIKGEYRCPNPGEIGILVKTFRQAQGLKQAALAAASGVTTRMPERIGGVTESGFEGVHMPELLIVRKSERAWPVL
jgi:hypothetical protein